MTGALDRARTAGLAVALMALCFAYVGIRTYAVGWKPAADPGIDFDEQTLRFTSIQPLGAADRAGLRPHDRLLAIEGRPVKTALEVHDALRRAGPGDTLLFTVNLAGLNHPRTHALVMDARQPDAPSAWVVVAFSGLIRSFPMLLLAAVAVLLFARGDRLESWLFALVAIGAIATAPLMSFIERIPPGARGFAVASKVMFAAAGPVALHWLLSIFPQRSALDHHEPRIKEVGLFALVAGAMPFAVWALSSSGIGFHSTNWSAAGPWVVALAWIAALAVGAWSLAECALSTKPSAVRERARIVGAGGMVAVVPAAIVGVLVIPRSQTIGELPLWIQITSLVASLPLPLAAGYAIAANEVLPLRAALRRLTRWLVVGRGVVVPIAVVAGIAGLALADLVAGWIGAAVAAALVWGSIKLHRRVVASVERTLFASDWQARRTIGELSCDFGGAATIADVLAALDTRIRTAFRPSFLAVYLKNEAGGLKVERGDVGRGREEIPLDTVLPVPGAATIGGLDRIARVGPDFLVPILGTEPGLVGLLVLGEREVEGPYSAEEQGLLATAGAAAGAALARVRSAAIAD